MGAPVKEIALVLCLVLLAGAMAVASEPLVPPVFGVRVVQIGTPGVPTGSSPGPDSTPGMLLIQVTSTSALSENVANASVSVVRADIGPLFPVTYRTNSTGQLELSLPPSNYSVSVFGLPMNVSVPLQVLSKSTTEMQLTVTNETYQQVFLDVSANQSDIVPAWSHGTMELTSSVVLLGTSSAFLDLYYNPGSGPASNQNGQQERQAPVVITGSEVRSTTAASDEWIAFQPETPIVLSGLASVQLAVYGAYVNVTMDGGISHGN